MKLASLILVSALPFASAAIAQTSTVSVGETAKTADGQSSSSLKEIIQNKKFEDTKEITDAKLRAESGSLSRYSLSFNLSYYGPALSDLGAEDQPNPDGSLRPVDTALSGSLGGRYRIDSQSTISMGTGLKAIHPFHGMEKFEMNNPYLSYAVSKRYGNLQIRNSPNLSVITLPIYTKVGEYGSLGYDISSVYNIGSSGFAVGFDTSLSYFLYNRGYRPGSPSKGGDGKASLWNISFFPNVKYNFSDKLNINSSLSYSYSNRRSSPDQMTFEKAMVSQRLGLGYAVTRDIYLAPYLNFYPDQLNSDLTTVNFSTVFSIL